MFVVLAKKAGTTLAEADLPAEFPHKGNLSGADIEGIIGRALPHGRCSAARAAIHGASRSRGALAGFMPSTQTLEARGAGARRDHRVHGRGVPAAVRSARSSTRAGGAREAAGAAHRDQADPGGTVSKGDRHGHALAGWTTTRTPISTRTWRSSITSRNRSPTAWIDDNELATAGEEPRRRDEGRRGLALRRAGHGKVTKLARRAHGVQRDAHACTTLVQARACRPRSSEGPVSDAGDHHGTSQGRGRSRPLPATWARGPDPRVTCGTCSTRFERRRRGSLGHPRAHPGRTEPVHGRSRRRADHGRLRPRDRGRGLHPDPPVRPHGAVERLAARAREVAFLVPHAWTEQQLADAAALRARGVPATRLQLLHEGGFTDFSTSGSRTSRRATAEYLMHFYRTGEKRPFRTFWRKRRARC